MDIDYSQRIPNNIDLAVDRTLQRALEHWQPEFLSWWNEMGPEGSHGYDVYLRTATRRGQGQLSALAESAFDPLARTTRFMLTGTHERDWLATDEDRAFVQSLMGRVVEPGKFASFIMPPSSGINSQPVDAEYVRFG